MILYNITISLEPGIEKYWLAYMQQQYIPSVMKTGLFRESRLFRLLNAPTESGPTFAVQFIARNLDDVDQYLEKYASTIVGEHNEKYRHQHVSFMTMLESIDQ
jgi:hypothetical protein